MKLQNIFWAACVLGGTLALSGCEKYDQLFPEQYHCVLNMKDAGIRNVELYTTDTEGSISVSVMKTGSEGDVSANGAITPMPEESFQAYCSANGLTYAYLPAEYYSLQDNELQFSAQERYKFVKALLKTREIRQLQENTGGEQYALPLLLRGSDVSVNDSLLIIVPDIKEPAIGFANAGFTDVVSFSSGGAATFTHTLDLTLPIPNTWGLQCTLACNDEAREAFEKYNSQSDNRYTLLPESAYTLPENGLVTFGNEAATASVDITFSRAALDMKEYILPLSIAGPTVEGVEINAARKTVLLGVTYSPDKLELKASQFHANSVVETGDGTGYTGLIDGLGSGLHFHSKWRSTVTDATYGNYIDVTLSAPIQSVKLDYWTRFENGNAAPTHIKLFTSTNGTEWTELGDIASGLPTGANQQYSSPVYRAEQPFSHFRFAVLESVVGSMTNGSAWFNLGELVLYGN